MTFKNVRRVDGYAFLPRADADVEAQLDAVYDRVGTLKWKITVPEHPELPGLLNDDKKLDSNESAPVSEEVGSSDSLLPSNGSEEEVSTEDSAKNGEDGNSTRKRKKRRKVSTRTTVRETEESTESAGTGDGDGADS